MTGFKTGPTDLYDDDEVTEEDETVTDAAQVDESTKPMTETETVDDPDDSVGQESAGMPFVTRRRAKDEEMTWQRNRVTFYVREENKAQESVLKSDAEVHFSEEISKFDLREAMYQAAIENPELVFEQLESMGIGYDFE